MNQLQSITRNALGQLVAIFKGGVSFAVGEYVENFDTSFFTQSTPADNTFYATGQTLKLSKGFWLVGYGLTMQTEAPTGVGAVIFLQSKIRDVTANVDIIGAMGGSSLTGGGFDLVCHAETAKYSVGSAGAVVQAQIGWRSNGGTPSVSAIYSRADRKPMGNHIWALKIGAGT